MERADEAASDDRRGRLTLLARSSASLLAASDRRSVVKAVLAAGRELLSPDALAVWRTDNSSSGWRIELGEGFLADFGVEPIHFGDDALSKTSGSCSILAITDLVAVPMLQEQWVAYRNEGIHSLLVCSLVIGGNRSRRLVLYYRTRHVFTDVDTLCAETLANLSSAAITVAELGKE